MNESTYNVQGMTCGHCVSSVTEEVGQIDGVQHVKVDLSSGRVVITSDAALPAEAVASAISEAGFELAQ